MKLLQTIATDMRALNRRLRGPIAQHRVDPWRRATSAARLKPNFLVIGEMKCGTSSIYSWLLQHPAIGGYPHKEVCYFDLRYSRGPAWYRSHFPLAASRKESVGEASPHYLFHPHAAGGFASTTPTCG